MATMRRGKVEKVREGEITRLYVTLRSLDFTLHAVGNHSEFLNGEGWGVI